jgi:hypothetical protein
MIWSTLNTVLAASHASLMAHALDIIKSNIPLSLASSVPVPSSFYTCQLSRKEVTTSTYFDINTGRPVILLVMRRV